MTMDSTITEHGAEGKQSVAITDLHSEITRDALLRLNVLHEQTQMATLRHILFIGDITKIAQEHQAIKERVEQRMVGFNVWYSNECQSYMLVPQKWQGDTK